MQFKKTIPYKLKRIIPMLGIAGASLFMGGCEKEEPLRDVELYFSDSNFEIFDTNAIQEAIDQPDVRTVYLVATGGWETMWKNNIKIFVESTLRPSINMSPKVRGKGDFNFRPGQASLVPEDSLWITQQGWTINKYRSPKEYQ